MPEKQPEGWAKTTLGEIAQPSRERALPAEVPEMRYIGLEHIEPHTMRLLGHGQASEVRSSSMRFSHSDVLYGKMRPYLNKVWVAEFGGICSAEFLVFPKCDGLNSFFLALRLNAEDFVSYANGRVSGERPRINFKVLSRFPILLPPASEQERIVAKLNAALAKTGRAEAATRRALNRLKRYDVAILHAAVTGKLTREWRKSSKSDETGAQFLGRLLKGRRARWEEAESQRLRENGRSPKNDKWKSAYSEPTAPETIGLPKLPRTWAWASLQQLGFIIGGLTKSPRRIGLRLKLPYLRVANVYANELRLEDVTTIGVEKGELDKLLLEKGDLLIVEGNGSKDQIGRLAIWDGSIEKCVHQNHIIKVRLVEKALGIWILSWLLSPLGRHQVEKVASSTTGLYTLSVGKVGSLPVPLPPSLEQIQIVREMARRVTAAERLNATLNRQLDRARKARQSLLSEAFAGHLVPQDPTEQPASVLLGRIRAAREAEAKQPKGKRMPKPGSKVTRRPLLDVLHTHKKPISPEQLFRESGFQQEFEENECRQDIVDKFYEELRGITGPRGPVTEKRPNRNTVFLEVKP